MKTKAIIEGTEYTFCRSVKSLGSGKKMVLCTDGAGVMYVVEEELWDSQENDAPVTHGSSKEEKIRFFLQLFQGREDVFAKRFFSRKTGRAGYGPACRNNGVYGVCDHRVRCTECPHRAFYAFDAAAAEAHLKGLQPDEADVCGIYPVRKDHTVFFLVLDFDEKKWRDDVKSVREACRMNGIVPAVERSRSGDGAHIWFFFSGPVPAKEARRLGSLILTYAMEKLRHQLPFSSFDKMFPAQDYVPDSGFGNLIALPFQGRAAARGNSLFVDDAFVPYGDQWAFLSAVPRITREELSELITVFSGQCDFLPVSREEKPWQRQRRRISREDLPAEAELHFGSMVYVKKEGFSEAGLSGLRKLGAFANPSYRMRQRMRQSVYGVPRVIDCSFEDDVYIGLPRGCLDSVKKFLAENEAEYRFSDERTCGRTIRVSFCGTLKEEQKLAAEAMLAHETGILEAQPSFGKTVVAAYLIAERKVNTLILVHRSSLLTQWKDSLERFLGIDEELPPEPVRRGRKRKQQLIGQIGQQKRIRNGIVDIAIYASLFEDDGTGKTVLPYVAEYGMVIVDECHHAAAETFERVMREVNARYVYGLSATPNRSDGHHPVVFMQCGPIRFRHGMRDLIASRGFRNLVVPRFTSVRLPDEDLPGLLSRIGRHPDRNRMIAQDARALIAKGRTVLILTERKEQASWFAQELKDEVNHMFLLLGSDSMKEKKEKLTALRSLNREESFAVSATGRYVGEGFDVPRMDTLLLAMPVSGESVVLQYVGRVLRESEGKKEIRIYDYADVHISKLDRMYRKRTAVYKKLGLQVEYSDPAEQMSSVIAAELSAERFAEDVSHCSKSVVLFCTHVHEAWQKPLADAFRSAAANGAVCECAAWENEGLSRLLREAGVSFRAKKDRRTFAVLDDEIVWYGGDDFLSGMHEAVRIVSFDVAAEFLERRKNRDYEQMHLFG